jgi:CRISPR-associated protein Cmr1
LNFEGDKETLSLLAALLLFLEKWGSIGAKPQLGYGVFKITNRSVVQSHAQHFWQEDAAIYKEKSTSGHNSDVDLPDMRHFGFVSYHFKPQKATWWTHAPGLERVAVEVQPIVRDFRTAPLAPPLKNEWRFRRWYLESMDKKRIQEMWMFGALRFPHKGELCRVRSKVAVSWAYPVVDGWEMRSWAWLQDQGAASKVWELMRDEGSWEAAIKLPGKINSYPDGPWNVWDIKDLAEFLEGTKW